MVIMMQQKTVVPSEQATWPFSQSNKEEFDLPQPVLNLASHQLPDPQAVIELRAETPQKPTEQAKLPDFKTRVKEMAELQKQIEFKEFVATYIRDYQKSSDRSQLLAFKKEDLRPTVLALGIAGLVPIATWLNFGSSAVSIALGAILGVYSLGAVFLTRKCTICSDGEFPKNSLFHDIKACMHSWRARREAQKAINYIDKRGNEELGNRDETKNRLKDLVNTYDQTVHDLQHQISRLAREHRKLSQNEQLGVIQ